LKLEASKLVMSCPNGRLKFCYTCSHLVALSTISNEKIWGRYSTGNFP